MPDTTQDTIAISITDVDAEAWARLRTRASTEHRSAAQTVRLLIDYYARGGSLE